MGKPCKSQGFPLAGHISRILSRVTIHLCSYPVPRRAASAEPVRLAPDGVWRAAVSPRRWWALTPPFHPYRRRLRRFGIRRRRFAFCATFRRLSPPGISPASCPAVSGLSSNRPRGRLAVTRPAGRIVASLRRHVGRAQAAVDDERRRVYVARLV